MKVSVIQPRYARARKPFAFEFEGPDWDSFKQITDFGLFDAGLLKLEAVYLHEVFEKAKRMV